MLNDEEGLSGLYVPHSDCVVAGCSGDACACWVECGGSELICMAMKLLVRRARRNVPDMANLILLTLMGSKPASVRRETNDVIVFQTSPDIDL